MLLYLMRHGDAVAPTANEPDAHRALSPLGQQQMTLAGRAFRALGFQPARLLCSPYRRAQETAERVGAPLGLRPEVVHQLHPGSSVADVKLLAEVYRVAPLLLVGHQPALGQIIALLTNDRPAIHPGTLAVLEVDGSFGYRAGKLATLYHPTDYAALAADAPSA